MRGKNKKKDGDKDVPSCQKNLSKLLEKSISSLKTYISSLKTCISSKEIHISKLEMKLYTYFGKF